MSSEEELAAHLDKDEAMAKAATPGPWEPEEPLLTDVVTSALLGRVADCSVGTGYRAQSIPDAAHIARHDPGRTLRFVEAMRAIIRESNGEGHGWAEHEPAYYAGLEFAVTVLSEAYGED